ncbi:MAG: NAD(P)-binding protein [Stomatobaculum sp.]|nr:NAD(P)-binding protein [Stomatobaculum sp.]
MEERVLAGEQVWRWSHKSVLECIEEELPACTTACPFRMDIRDLLGKVQKGQFDAAFRRFSNSVGFPFLVSRHCGEHCRSVCVMGNHGGALDMPKLERAILSFARNTKPNRYNMPPKKERIAVVGAGMSGLACALRFLNRKYPVSVFEASGRAGGCLLQTVAPEFLQEEIDRQFQFEKCDWHFNVRVKDVRALIRQGYAAVYVATGKDGDDFGLFPGRRPEGEQGQPDGKNEAKVTAGLEEGIFFGGAMTGADPMEAIAQGFQAQTLIEGFLKTRIMRNAEPAPASRIQLAERFIKETPQVLPADGEQYTREEAVEEASRCFRCQCDACQRGCGILEYSRKTVKPMAQEVYVTVRPGTLDGNGTVCTRMIGSCNHCGYCTDVCPAGIDIDRFLLQSHSMMQQKGAMPWAFHEYWLRDMEYSNGKGSYVEIDREHGNSAVFFPGCQIGASDPRYVTESWKLLKELIPDAGLHLGCCGAPAVWAADDAAHREVLEKIRGVWQEAGRPVYVMTCPSCMKMFGTYLPEIPVKSFYEVLDEKKVSFRRKGSGETYYIFDPCSSRNKESLKQSVRRLAERGGYFTEDSGGEATCCSYGGQVEIADPGYTDWLAKKRASESELPYLTYCINCRERFAGQGKETVHLLDLLLDLNDGNRLPPGVNRRYEQKRKLSRILRGEDPDVPEKEEAERMEKFWELDPELKKKLDLEHLFCEDVCAVVEACEESGMKVLDRETGFFTGCKMIGNITCWATYRMEDGKYRIINAYSHRMKVEE